MNVSLLTFMVIGESELSVTPALIVVLAGMPAFVVWITTFPPVRLSMVVPEPAVFAKSSGRLELGGGAVPTGDPTGGTFAGPKNMEPPPVDIATEALSGRLIVRPIEPRLMMPIAVPDARDEVIELPAPRFNVVVSIKTPASEDS